MKNWLIGIITASLCFPVILSGNESKGIEYNFIHNGNYYSFKGSFAVTAEFDCLIDVVYEFKHISKYSSGANSLELIQQGENWHDVIYTYRKFRVFENQSTWRRTLIRDEGKVVFEMTSSKNNLKLMPEALHSKGYYLIKTGDEDLYVEYFQECKFKAGILKDIYIKEVKKRAIQFLYEFKKYIERTCD